MKIILLVFLIAAVFAVAYATIGKEAEDFRANIEKARAEGLKERQKHEADRSEMMKRHERERAERSLERAQRRVEMMSEHSKRMQEHSERVAKQPGNPEQKRQQDTRTEELIQRITKDVAQSNTELEKAKQEFSTQYGEAELKVALSKYKSLTHPIDNKLREKLSPPQIKTN